MAKETSVSEEEPPPPVSTFAAERLTTRELEELLSNLGSAPLGVGEQVRLSLAGVQEKLVLTKVGGGGWARPARGTPSTHILKPEIPEYGDTVENEAFCMRFAHHLGLEAATVAMCA